MFNYYVLKFVCRYVFIDVQGRGFNIKIQENTLIDSKLKDKLTETIAQKFFLTQIFSEKGRGLVFFSSTCNNI